MTVVAEYAATRSTSTTSPPTNEALDASAPTIETAAHRRSQPRWKKVRDVFAGTEAIRAGGDAYLPQFAGESDTEYAARLTVSAFFNGYKRTVEASVGLLMEPAPVLGSDMPTPLVFMWENVDGEGTHGVVFCHDLLTAGINDGFAGIFTDFTRADDPTLDLSRASAAAEIAIKNKTPLDDFDANALGLRPYFILVRADEVLCVYERRGGRRVLVMLIRRQVATKRTARFGFETVTYLHVNELVDGRVTYQRWTAKHGESTPTPDGVPIVIQNLTAIPWSPLACGPKIGDNEYLPTLIDLAELNITHHRIATGILSLEEQACVPTPVRIGAPPDKDGNYPAFIVGASRVIEIPLEQGTPDQPVYYLSPPVDVLSPGMQSLENCKAEMASLGAAMLAPETRVQRTATETEVDAAAERATIGTIGRRFKDCLESAFGFAAQYLKTKGGSVTVNKDFVGRGLDPAKATVALAAMQAGALTMQEFRHFLATGQLPEDFKAEDMVQLFAEQKAREDQKRIEAEAELERIREENGLDDNDGTGAK